MSPFYHSDADTIDARQEERKEALKEREREREEIKKEEETLRGNREVQTEKCAGGQQSNNISLKLNTRNANKCQP